MRKGFIAPDAPPPAGPYSHAVMVHNHLYLSGQGPLDSATNAIVGETIGEQVEQTLSNLGRILHSAGLERANLVSMRVFLSNLNDFEGMTEAYGRFFEGVTVLPVRTTVQVGLPQGMLVEIDGIAVAD